MSKHREWRKSSTIYKIRRATGLSSTHTGSRNEEDSDIQHTILKIIDQEDYLEQGYNKMYSAVPIFGILRKTSYLTDKLTN